MKKVGITFSPFSFSGNMTPRFKIWEGSILLFSLFIGCSNQKSYPVRGTILEIDPLKHEFLIHHDEIPGFMMAMTMPFRLLDSRDIDRFAIGDSVKFRLVLDERKTYASKFQLIGKGTIPNIDNDWDDEYTPLEVGEIFSDCTFLNTDSNEVSLSSSDGKFRLISYIFTRCPAPNMCPAVVVKNQYLAESFSEHPELELILVSFDYQFDTPAILAGHYANVIERYPNMNFLSSTNHLNDIFSLAGQSFVSFWGVDENDIGHTLRSVLIDPERRLMKVFEGTDWRPEAAERDIRNILKAYNL